MHSSQAARVQLAAEKANVENQRADTETNLKKMEPQREEVRIISCLVDAALILAHRERHWHVTRNRELILKWTGLREKLSCCYKAHLRERWGSTISRWTPDPTPPDPIFQLA